MFGHYGWLFEFLGEFLAEFLDFGIDDYHAVAGGRVFRVEILHVGFGRPESSEGGYLCDDWILIQLAGEL